MLIQSRSVFVSSYRLQASGEGTHFLVPWLQKAILYDVRIKPRVGPCVLLIASLRQIGQKGLTDGRLCVGSGLIEHFYHYWI